MAARARFNADIYGRHRRFQIETMETHRFEN
jgi:hypothetical protein